VEVGPEAVQNVAHNRQRLAPGARHLVQVVGGASASRYNAISGSKTHVICIKKVLARCLVVVALGWLLVELLLLFSCQNIG
jgi:hypothetical protein